MCDISLKIFILCLQFEKYRKSVSSILRLHDDVNNVSSKKKQAQRRAAAETTAFIRVVRYNDESSFDLDNYFEMNPASTKT